MKNKLLPNWTKEKLSHELRLRNFQYGELANKYDELKRSSVNSTQCVNCGDTECKEGICHDCKRCWDCCGHKCREDTKSAPKNSYEVLGKCPYCNINLYYHTDEKRWSCKK